ncbi:MAG TPA: hypothetical protein IAC04_05010 [Candidatus Coprenecus stercoravium]|uniref:Uncharacterized protein n=1 Tax=Candidatus Coprenecus stercoravium TaxID=2840735 RepID=A0A9D2GRB9_9BACT|nr:hypothetical protein [Candidatus Coprenecus stercoravium]
MANCDITAVYDGETYRLDEAVSTKAYKAQFKGLYSDVTADGRHCVRLGEFNGDDIFENSTVVLDWGNGGDCDTIVFNHDFWWENQEPRQRTNVCLNGSGFIESQQVSVVTTGCAGMIWDFVPVNIEVMVQDADGNDLLNPETEGNISDNNIKAIFEGGTYERDVDVATKDILVVFHGLLTDQYDSGEYAGRYYLKFGEFARNHNYEKEFVLDWGDGIKRDTVSFTQSCEWKGNKPETATTVSLNGSEPVEGDVVTIVMDPKPVNAAMSLTDFVIDISNVSDIIITCRENDDVIY